MLGIPGNVAVSGHVGTGSCLAPLQWDPTTAASKIWISGSQTKIPEVDQFIPKISKNLQESPNILKHHSKTSLSISKKSPKHLQIEF